MTPPKLAQMPEPLVPNALVLGPSGMPLNSLRERGIKAIVDLNQDISEREEARKCGLQYVYKPSVLKVDDKYQPIPVEILDRVT